MNQKTEKTQYEIQPPQDVPRYAWPAWVSCLQWALGEPECRAAFEAETGFAYSVPRTPIKSMIDEATGLNRAYIEAFIFWFNAKIWGAWEAGHEA